MYPRHVGAKQFPRADVVNIIATSLSHVVTTINGPALPDIVLPAAFTLPQMVEAPIEESQAIVNAMKSRWNEWLPLHLLPIEVFIEILLYVDCRENIANRNRTLSLVCKYWRSVVTGYSDFWAQVRFEDNPQFIREVIARGPTSGLTVICDLYHKDQPDDALSNGGVHLTIHHHIPPWVFNQPLGPHQFGMQDVFGLGGGPGMAPEPEPEDAAWMEEPDRMQPDPSQWTTDSRNPFFFNTTLGARVKSFTFDGAPSPFRRQYIYKMSRKITNDLEISPTRDFRLPPSLAPISLARHCQMEHLTIRGGNIRWENTSFTRLRSLRLYSLIDSPPSTASLRDIISSCPSLECIVLQRVGEPRVQGSDAIHMQEAIPPIFLPNLRSLLCMMLSPELHSLFLYHVIAPNLTYICSEHLAPDDFHSESFFRLLEGPLAAAANVKDTIDVAYEDFERYLSIGLKHRQAGGWSPLTSIWEASRPGIEFTVQLWDTAQDPSALSPLMQFISNQNGRLSSISFEAHPSSRPANPGPQPRWFFNDPAQLSFLRQWSSVTHLCFHNKVLADILLNYLSTSYHADDG